MPISKSLKKVSKKVHGSDKSLHPNGRKFKQLNRATLREEKLSRNKSERNNLKETKSKLTIIIIYIYIFFSSNNYFKYIYLFHIYLIVFRYTFFKAAVLKSEDKENHKYTDSELRELCKLFISRDDDTLEKLKEKRRPGRPASSQQDALQQRIDRENSEFKSGFSMYLFIYLRYIYIYFFFY